MRKRNKPWVEREMETNENVIKDAKGMKGKWQEFFNNDNPIYLEIGCGKGKFIIENAKRFPDINYIGFEKEEQVIASGVRMSREEELNNVAFINGDVKDLEEYFALAEISRLYINFCDPWRNRKKWFKRRLTHTNFLKIYENLFNEGEREIFFKTDNLELFEFSLNEFCKNDWKLSNISLNLHQSEYHLSGENIVTEYETKFSEKGFFINRLEARK